MKVIHILNAVSCCSPSVYQPLTSPMSCWLCGKDLGEGLRSQSIKHMESSYNPAGAEPTVALVLSDRDDFHRGQMTSHRKKLPTCVNVVEAFPLVVPRIYS